MADEQLSPEETLLQKQKLEKRELQATIQGLKKTATKGDKKKKKDVQEQIAKLESDLLAKHSNELSALNNIAVEQPKSPIADLTEQVADIDIKENAPKLSKAQKRRNNKASANREREQRIAEQEELNVFGERNIETNKIKEKLKIKGLMIYEIPSDGDCLYKAVDVGLTSVGVALGVTELRKRVANHILKCPNDYLPFLSDPESGNPLNEHQIKAYCEKIANTKEWGGHVELDAISHVVKKLLVVVQSDGPDLLMGEQYRNGGEITLTYHRHMYRLGDITIVSSRLKSKRSSDNYL